MDFHFLLLDSRMVRVQSNRFYPSLLHTDHLRSHRRLRLLQHRLLETFFQVAVLAGHSDQAVENAVAFPLDHPDHLRVQREGDPFAVEVRTETDLKKRQAGETLFNHKMLM